jgi:hypothetical protein
MRLLAALALCLLGAAVPSLAQEHVGPDGFSICQLTSDRMGPCEPLTDAAIESYHLSGAEQQIVRQLKRLAVSPDQAVFDDLANAFAPQRLPIGTTKFTDLWYPDLHDPQAGCFICGLHVKFAEKQLVQINYPVSGQFIVIWNRVLVAKPPQ